MTVTTTLDRQYFDGDGSNKMFPFNFRFFSNDQIYVSLIAPDGTVTLQAMTTNYTLAGALQANGGTVTMLVPPPIGTQVFVQRIVAEVQPTSIRNQGRFFPEVHEDVFDRLTMLVQQALSGVRNSLQLLANKSGWDFKGYKGVNVGDGAAAQDAVNIRTMRSYVDAAVAGVAGGFGYFLQSGIGAVMRTFQSKMRDVVHVRDFIQPGDTDYSQSANRASNALKAVGGGKLIHGNGVLEVASPIILQTGVVHIGQGFGNTVIAVRAGANCDAFKSENFDSLTGVGPITAAPYAYGVLDLTIQGNYLDLGPTWTEISWADATAVLNMSGCGIKSFGTRCEFRVEVFNVADNAIYQEAIGAQFANSTAGARVWLDGRISGQEAMIMRGPGDSSLDFIAFGLCGILPVGLRAATASLASKVYPADQVHGIVIDNLGVYEGHCEITRAHIYTVSFGVGFKTLGVCRLNALHLIADNCRGGYDFSAATHGLIAEAESRGNARQPTGYTGSPIAVYPCLKTQEGGAWVLECHLKTSRYAPSINDSDYAVQIGGSSGIFSITRQGQNQGNGLPLLSPLLLVTGDSNNISFTCERQRGNVVNLIGNSNNIRGTCTEVSQGTVLIRDTTAGKACFNNSVNITAEKLATTCTLFNAMGNASSEIIKLLGSGTAGYTKFTGDAMAAVNRAVFWEISALDGSSINGKSTRDYIEAVVPNTPIAGDIVVPHNFLYQPSPLQVDPKKRFAGAAPDQSLDLGVKSTSATDVTIAYRWSALPSSGSATLVVLIE